MSFTEKIARLGGGGKKGFYRHVLAIAVPIMIQNGITNFVNLLDNVMVGRIGTAAMSGVAVVNQLIFVWNLCIFGGLSGIAIFTAQFYGRGDTKGVRHTFRAEMMLAAVLTAAGLAVFRFFDKTLILLYLHEDGSGVSAAATMTAAQDYMAVMLAGFAAFAITQVYSSTLRSTGETLIPMKASVVAVAVNLVGNYILIYGKLGAPALGVMGAALATCLSRVVEMIYVVVWTHRHPERNAFIVGAYRSFKVPGALIKACAVKGTPLLINEALWAGGQALLVQIYSLRGLSVVAALNIAMTVSNVFNVAFIAMGSAIGIVIGQELGSGRFETVKGDANRLSVFSIFLGVISGAGLFAFSGIFPQIYNTTPEIRALSTDFMRISAVCMPIFSYVHAAYFVMRSGGRTGITFIFDSFFQWVASIPVAFALTHFTGAPIQAIYLAVQLVDLIKCLIGYILIQKGVWIRDLTELAA